MANVSVATVFNYFPTREALVEQVLVEVENEFSALLEECLGDKNRTLHERLTYISHNLIDTVLEQQDWIKVWFWSGVLQYVRKYGYNLLKLTVIIYTKYVMHFLKPLIMVKSRQEQTVNDLAKLLHGICYVLYIQANLLPDQTVLHQQAETYLEALALTR